MNIEKRRKVIFAVAGLLLWGAVCAGAQSGETGNAVEMLRQGERI